MNATVIQYKQSQLNCMIRHEDEIMPSVNYEQRRYNSDTLLFYFYYEASFIIGSKWHLKYKCIKHVQYKLVVTYLVILRTTHVDPT
jgi:hypothetical protein